jgi:hypothetical protein
MYRFMGAHLPILREVIIHILCLYVLIYTFIPDFDAVGDPRERRPDSRGKGRGPHPDRSGRQTPADSPRCGGIHQSKTTRTK